MGVLYAKVGGAWVPALGPNEVFVGSDQPTDPDVELWYDTDDPGLSGGVGLEAAKPAAPPVGTRYFATDTLRDWLWDGTGWIIKAEPEVAWTPTWTNVTLGNGTSVGRYHRSDGWIDFWASFNLGSTSAMGTAPTLTLPISPRSAEQTFSGSASQIGVARTPCLTEVLTGTTLKVRVANTNADVAPTVPFTWGTSGSLFVHGRYQMASRYT